MRRGFGQNCRLIEVSAEAMAFAAINDTGALGKRIRDMLLDLGDYRFVDQRALDTCFHAFADLESGDHFGEALDESVIDTVLDTDPVGADTSLAGIAEFRGDRSKKRRNLKRMHGNFLAGAKSAAPYRAKISLSLFANKCAKS